MREGGRLADLVLFGTGDIARLADHYFDTDSDHRVVAFCVDDAFAVDESFLGRPLVPFRNSLCSITNW